MIQIENGVFALSGENYSYIFKLLCNKPVHVYYGPYIPACDPSVLATRCMRSFSPYHPIGGGDQSISLDTLPLEYGERGRGDYRTPALTAETDGDATTDFFYTGHTVSSVHPTADGLPTLRGGETLTVTLQDQTGNTLDLYYTVYPQALVRRARLTAAVPTRVTKLSSLSLDLPETYTVTGLFGRHVDERNIDSMPLTNGSYTVSSTRGTSSHQQNPFLALSQNADETHGLVYGVNLVYSGSFDITAAVDSFASTRVVAGYNTDTFTEVLQPAQSLTSPECVLAVSDCGFGGLSRSLHDLYRDYLIPEKYARAPRPIVINSWEGCYFDFDTDKLLGMIKGVKGLGIDMFVLDDGWFGNRNGDDSGLGDWYVNTEKLRGGLKPIIDATHAAGMRFGLWFEPEMISEDSDLYRRHPDYVLRTARTPVLSRKQMVLDFSKPEVVDNVYAQMEAVLSAYEIDYIKWDLNRHITDIPDLHTQHGFVLGTYALARRLTERFPDLFMEGCSGGGGRFDAGMLAFFPQIWTSDNTDAVARTRIQYGTSLAYPLSAMSNHVSICPNHQTGRTTPFETRAAIAYFGAFGYEFNPSLLTNAERDAIREQTAAYRKYQDLYLSGDLYRLKNPFAGNAFCFQVTSKDRALSRITYMQTLCVANAPFDRIYPQGLDDADYHIEELDVTLPAQAIMRHGIAVNLSGDFAAKTLTLRHA